MLARIASEALSGLQGHPVVVEADVVAAAPAFSVVGPARRRRPGEPGARARRDRQLVLRVPVAAHHREPRAGRPAQGGPVVRPADRARLPARHRSGQRRLRRPRAAGRGRRARARREPAAGRRGAGRGAEPAARAASAASCCRRRTPPRPRSCPGLEVYPAATLAEAVAQIEAGGGGAGAAGRPRRAARRRAAGRRRLRRHRRPGRRSSARSRSPSPARTTCS